MTEKLTEKELRTLDVIRALIDDFIDGNDCGLTEQDAFVARELIATLEENS